MRSWLSWQVLGICDVWELRALPRRFALSELRGGSEGASQPHWPGQKHAPTPKHVLMWKEVHAEVSCGLARCESASWLVFGFRQWPFHYGCVCIYTCICVCWADPVSPPPPIPLCFKYLTQDFSLFRCLFHHPAGMGIAGSYCLEVGMCPWAVYRFVLEWEVPCIQGHELGTLTRAEMSCIGAIGTILSVHSHVQNCSLLLL